MANRRPRECECDDEESADEDSVQNFLDQVAGQRSTTIFFSV
jgi:hypothetical protein